MQCVEGMRHHLVFRECAAGLRRPMHCAEHGRGGNGFSLLWRVCRFALRTVREVVQTEDWAIEEASFCQTCRLGFRVQMPGLWALVLWRISEARSTVSADETPDWRFLENVSLGV